MDLSKFWTVEEASRRLGVTQRTVFRYIKGDYQGKKLRSIKYRGMVYVPKGALKSFERPPMGNPILVRQGQRSKK